MRADLEIIQQWVRPGHQRGQNTHNVSATISIKDAEWIDVGEWMWENRSEYNGLSVIPFADHTYKQAPYQDIDEADYTSLLAKMPKNIDWTKLSAIEKEDTTTGTQELACTAGGCEI